MYLYLYAPVTDLKTANVFVTADGVLKLGDFGISRILTDSLDQANTVIGTPYYLSPEICQRQPCVRLFTSRACPGLFIERPLHRRAENRGRERGVGFFKPAKGSRGAL